MCLEDYFWLSKGEKFEDVHIRYLAEQNRINNTPIPFEVVEYPSEYEVIDERHIVKNITHGEI